MSVVYDAGALVAADRSERALWADHRARLELGLVPATTAPVVAQVSRSGRQAQLRRFLRGCDVEPLSVEVAHEVGELSGKAQVDDVVDVHVVLVAHHRRWGVVTSDVGDLGPIVDALGSKVALQPI